MRNVLLSKKHGCRNSLSVCGLQHFWKSRSLRIEPLEERRLLSVDLYLDMFRVDPNSTDPEHRLDLQVDYNVVADSGTASPFDIGIYSSVDGVIPGTLLMTHSVSGTGLNEGARVAIFEANFEDAPFDYYLMAKLDCYDAVVETDDTNNLEKFDGGTFMGADWTTNVVGRYVFYDNSYWDNPANDPDFNDDTAIAPDIFPLLNGPSATYPTQQTMFRNYTSYEKGLNGLMVDIWNLPTQLPVARALPDTSVVSCAA